MSAKDKPEEAANGMSDEKLIACLRGIFSTPRDQIDSNTLAIVARLAADRLSALTACQQEVERLRERSEKFKWQVRDTCRRAEAAEARNAELVKALEEIASMSMATVGGTHSRARHDLNRAAQSPAQHWSRAMKPEWCPQEVWGAAEAVYDGLSGIEGPLGIEPFRDKDIGTIARALLDAHQRGRREGMEEAGADIAERLRLRSLAINEALVEQRDVDAAVLMSCDLPNIPAAFIRAKAQEADQ